MSYASSKKKKKKMDKSVSLGDSRIERVRDRLDLLNIRVAVLEYSQLHKNFVCGFENVLRDTGIRAIPSTDVMICHP